jgi:hypothetical protein
VKEIIASFKSLIPEELGEEIGRFKAELLLF